MNETPEEQKLRAFLKNHASFDSQAPAREWSQILQKIDKPRRGFVWWSLRLGVPAVALLAAFVLFNSLRMPASMELGRRDLLVAELLTDTESYWDYSAAESGYVSLQE